MRGKITAQRSLVTLVDMESRVPADHPLRIIKGMVDRILAGLSRQFDDLYSDWGAPSVPPEQLLKARVLMALYTVRSERLFCEQLGYNLLWLWFLDRELDEGSWHPTVFTHNQERVLSSEGAHLFFAEVYQLSRDRGWTSDEHFTVDGTLIEAWAGMKSFVRKDGKDASKVAKGKQDDPSNPTIDFHGEKRSHRTHQSTTDPEAVLYRKAVGAASQLCHGVHVLMENRNGLCAGIGVYTPIARSETDMALQQVDEHQRLYEGVDVQSVGADAGYHNQAMVGGLRERQIQPHVACRTDRQIPGLDGRTTRSAGYRTSQRIRKRVEEIFGWMKTVGGFRQTRYRGHDRTLAWAYFVGAAFNLVRMAKLALGPPELAAPA